MRNKQVNKHIICLLQCFGTKSVMCQTRIKIPKSPFCKSPQCFFWCPSPSWGQKIHSTISGPPSPLNQQLPMNSPLRIYSSAYIG